MLSSDAHPHPRSPAAIAHSYIGGHAVHVRVVRFLFLLPLVLSCGDAPTLPPREREAGFPNVQCKM